MSYTDAFSLLLSHPATSETSPEVPQAATKEDQSLPARLHATPAESHAATTERNDLSVSGLQQDTKEEAQREEGEKDGEHTRAQGEDGDVQASADSIVSKGKKERRKKGAGAPKYLHALPHLRRGDVVFGKIIRITEEDIVFVDLMGKGVALFDKRELDPIVDESPLKEHAMLTEASASSLEAEQSTTHIQQEHSVAVSDFSSTPVGDAPSSSSRSRHAVALPSVFMELGAPFVGRVYSCGRMGEGVLLTRRTTWPPPPRAMIEKSLQEKKEVVGLVTGLIKGGVEVDIEGLRAFSPASHMQLSPGGDLSVFVGKRLPFFVIQYEKAGKNVVLSRKKWVTQEAQAKREALLTQLEIGSIQEGIPVKIAPFGVFVELEGVCGLVAREEVSHEHSEDPEQVMPLGKPVQVKVLRIDEKGHIWLSRKALLPHTWLEETSAYSIGSRHTGIVTRVENYGVVVQLEHAVNGIIQLPDLSLKRVSHPNEVCNIGDSIEVVVVKVDAAKHQVILHPALGGEQAEETQQDPRVNKVVKVMLHATDKQGLLVRICGVTGRFARGFIPAKEIGMPRDTDLRKAFPVGTTREAKVLSTDSHTGESELSFRAFQKEEERVAYRTYQQKVTKEAKCTFADLLAHRGKKLLP